MSTICCQPGCGADVMPNSPKCFDCQQLDALRRPRGRRSTPEERRKKRIVRAKVKGLCKRCLKKIADRVVVCSKCADEEIERKRESGFAINSDLGKEALRAFEELILSQKSQ